MKTRANILAAAALAIAAGAWGMDRPDSWVTTKVKTELAAHKGVSAMHTKVETNDGVVTLSGTARSDAERELAEQYARRVEGVRDVDNQIVVRSGSSAQSDENREQQEGMGSRAIDKIDDAALTSKVKAKLAGDRSTSALHTNVDTKDGNVTLTGTASSDAEKDMAERLAREVKGVKSVDNQIQVREPSNNAEPSNNR